jgi:hypothetical protein
MKYGVLSMINNIHLIHERHENIPKIFFGAAIAKSNDL